MTRLLDRHKTFKLFLLRSSLSIPLISSIPREGSETGRPCSLCVGASGLADSDVSRPIAVAKKAGPGFPESAFVVVER